MTGVREVLGDLIERFTRAGVPSPVVDAELIVGHVAGWTRGEVSAKAFMGAELDAAATTAIEALAVRRETREPLQHIIGEAPFRHLVLAVGSGALVPRPETEYVAELAIEALRQVPSPEPLAVDLGTGTGALALSLATEVPQSTVFAVELSPDAHSVAQRNIAALGEGRVTLVLDDAHTALPQLDGTVDVVVANPPYIPDAERPADREVSDFDPEMALYGGPDGLRDIRLFLGAAARLLHPGGTLVMEHGEHQGAAVRELAAHAGFRMTVTHRDFLHRDRVLTAVR